MIAINELRIGNYVFDWAKRISIVDSIHKDEIVRLSSEGSYKQESFEIKHLNPIPLTGEILLKCGFEYSEVSSVGLKMYDIKAGYYGKNSTLKVSTLDGIEWTWYFVGEYVLMNPQRIEYLHQLQNLYFALTNTELKIDL